MKLRNKKTGEIINAGDKFELASYAENGMSIQERHEYKSLSELCEDWEDYKPSEPLIKDEKIRNLVRNFAKYTNADWIQYESEVHRGEFWTAGGFIASNDWKNLDGLVNHRCYTADELCGEEEC